MTFRPLARLVAAASIASLAVLATACSSAAPGAEPSQSAKPGTAAPTEPSSAPDAGPSEPTAIAPTCENIVSESTVEQFGEAGWAPKPPDIMLGQKQPDGAFCVRGDLLRPGRDFMIGETQLDGAFCVWGDYSGPGSDNVAILGWSPLSKAEASEAQNELIDAGWIREDAGNETYITENPDYAIAVDENGYGMTYLFGDGWVSVADSKQALQLINAPRP